MFPMLVLYYWRSYGSVCDIKENAYMLYWKSVDHVQTHGSEACTQGKDKKDCLKDNFAQFRPCYTGIIAYGSANWPHEIAFA